MFQSRFADLIRSGHKRQTIRPVPKRIPQVGDLESWRVWSGKPYRSKTIELAQVKLTAVKAVMLEPTGATYHGSTNPSTMLVAHADGFVTWQEMRDWFLRQYGLPFIGVLIRAETLRVPLFRSDLTDRCVDGLEIFLRHERGETYRSMRADYGISAGRVAALAGRGRRILQRVNRKSEISSHR